MNRSSEYPSDSTDRRVDRTLEILGSVEPPTGLDRRVLVALETRLLASEPAENPSPTRLFRHTAAFLHSPRALVGGAAAVLILSAGVAFLHMGRPNASAGSPRFTSLSSQPASAPSPAAPVVAHEETTPAISARMARATLQRAPVSPEPPNPAPSPRAQGTAPPGAAPSDPQALDDLHAPSQPAPPMPLTAQEKLIVRLMRRGEGVQLAQLDPAQQAAFSRREQADFHDFFDPPLAPNAPSALPPEAQPPSQSAQPQTQGDLK